MLVQPQGSGPAVLVPGAGAGDPGAPAFDLESLLAGIDSMAAQRPVAAQIVSVATGEDTSARELSGILATDVALAGRVMKLANSAHFGMRGRVTSLQFAVTVIGFTTVRTMATVALADLDDESRLPEDFWLVTSSLALGASTLAPRFGERPQDALCLGLLARMGAALLHHNDPEGYGGLVAAEPTHLGRRAAEIRRYGLSSLELTAVALERWRFPTPMIATLRGVEDLRSVPGGLLRAAAELASRLTAPDHAPVPIARLTCGQLREEDVVPITEQVRTHADELRRAILGH